MCDADVKNCDDDLFAYLDGVEVEEVGTWGSGTTIANTEAAAGH